MTEASSSAMKDFEVVPNDHNPPDISTPNLPAPRSASTDNAGNNVSISNNPSLSAAASTSLRPTYELSKETLKLYVDHSSFTKREILKMHDKFHKLSHHGLDKITHDELLQVEQMRANPFASRICELFSEDGSGILSFENFLNMMSVFSIHTRPEVKMVWAFAMWDFDGDDIIGTGDIRHGLNLITCSGVAVAPSLDMIPRVPSGAGLQDVELDGIVEEIVKEVDPDGYGVGYHDFRGILSRMPDFLTNFRMSFW